MKKISTLLLVISLALVFKFSEAQTEVTIYTTRGTTKGNFVISLEQSKRPITTANFLKLVNQKFYDGIIFHRVINNFVIQGGDPTGTGSGGSGTTIPDELSPAYSNIQKTIGMATAGPNTATSQFYINLVNNTNLDPNYTAFGIVISNFSVVQAIGAVPTTGNAGNPPNKPLTDVVMDSVRVTMNPAGIYDMNEQSQNVEIFPNPVTDESMIAITSGSDHVASVSVYNQLGEEMYSEKRELTEGLNFISFEKELLRSFPAGMYYVAIGNENSSSQHKFLVVE